MVPSTRFSLIDSHTHLQFAAYDADRDAVMQRAREAGIGVINIGTQHRTSEDAIQLAAQYSDGVWATVGFYPGHAEADAYHDPQELREHKPEPFDYGKFLELARHPKVVAIGECGFDYFRIRNNESGIKERQREIFLQQIGLAREVGKPLVVHCRDAFEDLIGILYSKSQILNSPPGVVHFFTGTWVQAQRILELGFYLGFDGPITFARDYDKVVCKIPLDRILVETDAPYAAPVPYRGKRNEPAYVVEIAKKIAELRGVRFEEITARTTENTKKLFQI